MRERIRNSYAEVVIEGVKRKERVFVGNSIVRKTDKVLNKGEDRDNNRGCHRKGGESPAS